MARTQLLPPVEPASTRSVLRADPHLRAATQGGRMTTITSDHGEDHEERVHAIEAVLAAGAVLTGLLVGAAYVVSQLVSLLAWSFASH
jgi:hypothetical protein